ncbi:uncharacterized protein LOC142324100 isoform X2 [Lycorma delicatula]|uniref:uncharacterized protein LOC142324100 isoform X2 n=1 Tax=Lycorma delicatula TaxID=130591 RepID=UPI003F510DC9
MDQEREKKLQCDRAKMKKNTQIFVGSQRFSSGLDNGDHNEPSPHFTPGSSTLSPFASRSTGDDESEMIMTEGITAQLKRIGGQSKPQNKKYTEYLVNRIKELEDSLSNRNMMVSALQRELDLMKDVSVVDASAGPLNNSIFSPDSGDSSDQMGNTRSRTENQLLIKLKQKETEVSLLQDELRVRKQSGPNSLSERLSNKVVVLESEVKEHAETIEQLNLEIVQKTKTLNHIQEQLQKKSEDFGKQNIKTSLEIKELMRTTEELRHEVRNKDNELKQAKEELVALRSRLSQMTHSKKAFDEELDRVSSSHIDKIKQYSVTHETEIACYQKQIEALSNRVKEHSQSERELETELEACRLAHEAQIISYKECVESLMEELAAEKERNKIEYTRQIEKYKIDLEKCRNEINDYQQKVKELDSIMAEEVKNIEKKCSEQMEGYRSEFETQCILYKNCAESLKKKDELASKEIASLESKYKEHIDELNTELDFAKEEIKSINGKLKESEEKSRNVIAKLKEYQNELEASIKENNLLKEKLKENESNKVIIDADLKKYRSIIEDYEIKLRDCNAAFQKDIAKAEVRHENVVTALQNEIGHLMSTLTELKTSHEQEINQWVEQLMRNQQQLESVQELAECDSVEKVCDKLKKMKNSKDEVESLNKKLNDAMNSISDYETRLAELRKGYEDDITLYKNQIEKLKEELNNASSLEENLVKQLSNHVTGVKESKEQIKDLLRKDVQVYFFQNELSCHNFTESSSSTRDINNSNRVQTACETSDGQGEIPDEMKVLFNRLDHLNTENVLLKEELDNLKKPKCNVSIQSHCNKSNDLQRRHIEQALFNELEKELEDSKLENDSKTQDIEELIKVNNELADHYNKLEAEFSELKEFAALKMEEISTLQAKKDSLYNEKMQLESNQILLIAKLESMTEDSSKKVDLDSLSEENVNLNIASKDSYMNSQIVQKLFVNAATSTPNFYDAVDDSDENERDDFTPKRKIILEPKFKTNQLLTKWMNNCHELEVENAKLKKDLQIIRLQMKEMECCSEAMRGEMVIFDKNFESLKERIAELESKKKLIRELEQVNEQLKLRNEKLEEDRHILRSDVANLKEENLNMEKKYGETLSKLLAQNIENKPKNNQSVENLILELNKKAEEVLILKEEMSLKQETVTSLEDEVDKLLEIRQELTMKFNLVVQDLKAAEEELFSLRQEQLNLGLEKRLLDKKLTIVRAQNEQLLQHFGEKLQKDCSNGVITIVEELEKELVELHKNLSQERGVIERMSVERTFSKNSGNCSEDSETSYKIELLLHAFEQLQNEKEGLKRKTLELQEIINKYLDSDVVDENWKLEVKDSQKRLLLELESYGKQHADLGKTLVEAEDLKAKVELAEKELLLKIEEKAKVEELLAEERQGLSNALNRINFLERQLCEKMNVLQVLGEEKEDLQGNLWALQEKLCALEEHLQQQKLILEGEIQERDLRVRHAQLELHAAKLDKNTMINKMIMDAEVESEMEKVSRLREELEKEHDVAICRLKRLYTSQLQEMVEEVNVQRQNEEQNQLDQITALEEQVKLLFKQIQQLTNQKIIDCFGLKDVGLEKIEKNKEKLQEELKNIEESLDEQELSTFSSVKSIYENYAKLQIAHVTSILKKEHVNELETVLAGVNAEHKQKIEILHSTLKNEIIKEQSTVYKELEDSYVKEIDSLRWLLECNSDEISNEKDISRQTKGHRFLKLLIKSFISEYSSSLKLMLDAWQDKYRENLSVIDEELKCSMIVETNKNDNKSLFNLSEFDISKFDLSKTEDSQKFLNLKKHLINYAEDMQNTMKDYYKGAIEDIKRTIEEAHEKVVDTVEELKVQLNEGKLIASLENKICRLQLEKDQLEEGHKSAITLLLKDHEVELAVVKTLLSEFQPLCTEHCADINALTKQKLELEAKHEQQLEELRVYYEKKFAEVEKNYSEEVYSHHSRKMSCSSSLSENELQSDVCQFVETAAAALTEDVISEKEENIQFSKETVEQSDEEVQTDFQDYLSDLNIDFNIEPSFLYSNVHCDNQEIQLLKQINADYENEIKKLKKDLQEIKESKDNKYYLTGNKSDVRKNCGNVMNSENETEVSTKINILKKELNEKESKLKAIIDEHEGKMKLLKEQYENEIEQLRTLLENSQINLLDNSEKESDNLEKQTKESMVKTYQIEVKELKDKIADLENINVINSDQSNTLHIELNRKELDLQKLSNEEKVYISKLEELQKLLNTASVNQSIEENVKRIVEDVKGMYQADYERNKFEFLQRVSENYMTESKNLKEDLISHYKYLIDEERKKHEGEMRRLQDSLESSHQKVVSELEEKNQAFLDNLVSQMKRQEMDHVWSVTVEVEERYRNQINEINQSWEEKLANEMANAAAESALYKVTIEDKLRNTIKVEFEAEYQKKLENIRQEEIEKVQTELVQQRDKMLEIFGKKERLLRKEMEEKQENFLTDQERIMQEFTENQNSILQKVHLQHELLIKEIKKAHAEELEKAYREVEKTNIKDSSIQCNQEMLVDKARLEVLSALEKQIKILIAEGDDPMVKSRWPPELATLERQFRAKYQEELAALVQEHAAEMTELKTNYKTNLQLLAENCTCGASRGLVDVLYDATSEDGMVTKIIRERDSLRKLTTTLRCVVCELAKYLTTCEDELNNTLINALVKYESNSDNSQMSIIDVTNRHTDSESEGVDCEKDSSILQTPKRVHFAPDVINIVNDDSFLDCLDKNHDLSVEIRSELQSCLERLKLEAAAVLGLSTLKNKDSSTSVERRRLASVTRQLIEKNKANDELTRKLEDAVELTTKLKQDLADAQAELATERAHQEREAAAHEETVFDEKERDIVMGMEARLQNLSQLQEKAKSLVAKGKEPELPTQLIAMVEEMCSQGDQLLEEARREREDLQLQGSFDYPLSIQKVNTKQVEAADKQLRSTREFLEEQAAERESERDEFSRELSLLREQLRNKDRDWTTRERFATEWSALENGFRESTGGKVEALEQQVMETTNLLKETQKKKDEVESELKDAIDKVWVLREVIRDLECQVSCKSERQATLEQHLDELETELDAQNKAQNALAMELEAMREEANSDAHVNHLRQLEEQFKKQCSSTVLRQIKLQLREMAKSLQKRTKDLEGLNVHISSASLSSPSEDISIREQLDMFRCGSATPEGCQSPVVLPVDEISLLQEQMHRHARAEELAVKRIRDLNMQLMHLRTQYEDVQAERDVLQEKCDKQLSQLAATQTRLDDVRRRAEWEQAKTDAVLMEKISHIEEELVAAQKTLKQKEKEAMVSQHRITYLEKQVTTKDAELCAYADNQHKQIDLLLHEISVMEAERKKLEVMVAKCREGQSISIPALMEEILADKNADIDQLEQKVKELQTSSHNNSSFVEHKTSPAHASHSNSKGYRVSFADEVESPDWHAAERTREAENNSSITPQFQPFLNSSMAMNESTQKTSSKILQSPDAVLTELSVELSKAGGDYSPKWTIPPPAPDNIIIEELRMAIEELKQQLELKTDHLKKYEERLKEIPALEEELRSTRDELAATLASVAEDKDYCQEQLEIISQFQRKLKEKEFEAQQLKDELANKEENLIRVTADVKALQLLLEKLQKKINDAKESAKLNDMSIKDIELQKIKEENNRLIKEKSLLKKELDNVSAFEVAHLKQQLEDEKIISETLKKELKAIEDEKNKALSELDNFKFSCENTKSELNAVLKQLNNSETEITQLQNELKCNKESNKQLNIQLNEMKTDIANITAKAKLDMENHLKKDSDVIMKLKEELEQLRCINTGLETDCDNLRSELMATRQKSNIDTKLAANEKKMNELEKRLIKLESENRNLLEDKEKAVHKIEIEKDRYADICATAEAYKSSEKSAQETAMKEKSSRLNAEKKTLFIKREYDKIKRAKKELEKKNIVLKEELEKEKKHTTALEQDKSKVHRSIESLTFSQVDTFEIKPVDNRIGSLEDLAGQVQEELNKAAQLDSSLLSTLDTQRIEPNSNPPNDYILGVLHKIIQHGFQSLTSDEASDLYSEISSRIDVRSPGLSNMMDRLSELSSIIQNQKETIEYLKNKLANEKLNCSKEKEHVLALQTENERLQKIINYQEERLTSLSVSLEEKRIHSSELELCLLKEKGNFKKLQALLENEREKVKQIQRDDTELIQDLRMCLEEAKDSEIRLQLCLEQERDRLQTLEAQLNAARVVEQHFSHPSSDPNHMTKCLDDLKSKCTDLGVELEREKRNVGSLSVSLNKEKSLSAQLRTKLHSTHAENIQLQAQIEELKVQISEEQRKKCETQEKVKTIQEAEIRRQRSRAAAEERHRKALDRAKLQKSELEAEVLRLRKQLMDTQQEENATTEDASSLPLLLQIKEVNTEIERLVKEKDELTKTAASLLEKNKELEECLSQTADSYKNQNKDAKYFMGLYIRSKSHRKALIWQKRYLMLALQGYQESEEKLMSTVGEKIQNSSWVPIRPSTSKRKSLRLVALAIIAVTRMKSIVTIRKQLLGTSYKVPSPKREHLLKQHRYKSFSPINIAGPSSLSPPIRNIRSSAQRSNPEPARTSSPLLQPTRLADYLETFNELQSRLSQALGSTQKDLNIDRTIIRRVIN